MDNWTIAREVDNISQNSRGDPIRAIKTDAGYLKLSGDIDLLAQLFPGAKVRHGPVKVYGKTKFAALYEIERPQAAPKPASNREAQARITGSHDQQRWSQQAPVEHVVPPTKPPEPPIMGGLPQAQGVPTWDEYKRVFCQAHRLAYEYEPDIPCDPKTNDQFINNATARAAIINTIMIAFTNSKVQAPDRTYQAEPEIPGADAPFPDNEGFPWEPAS